MEGLKFRKSELEFIPRKEENKVVPVKLQAEELHSSKTTISKVANNLNTQTDFASTAFQASAKLELAKNAERIKSARSENYSVAEAFAQAISFI